MRQFRQPVLFLFAACLAAFLLTFPTTVFSATVNLAWDQPSDTSQIAGYKIYYCLSGGMYSNDQVRVVGDPAKTNVSISGLSEGEEYCFVSTSYDADGNESSYSNEVTYTVPAITDTDGDGLSDYEETNTYYTDPKLSDTDGDGLLDNIELTQGTDPTKADSDNDGLNDSEELTIYGTDPNNSDTDGDGITDGTEVDQGDDPLDSAREPSQLMMDFGEVRVDHNWSTVSLTSGFSDPIVVAGPLSLNGGDPAVVRIRDVTPDGFEIRLQEYEYLDVEHTTETVSYLAMEKGNFVLENGTHIEASYFEAEANYPSFDYVSFANQFAVQPVVMTSMTTFNGRQAATGRMKNVSTTGFEHALQTEEYSAEMHLKELVAYIAWEPSACKLEGTQFEVATAQGITHASRPLKLKQKFANTPSFLAAMQTCNGGDTANLRYSKKTSQRLKVNVAEEQSLDDEIRHANEKIGYIILSPLGKGQTKGHGTVQ